jgi:hypothetical protein
MSLLTSAQTVAKYRYFFTSSFLWSSNFLGLYAWAVALDVELRDDGVKKWDMKNIRVGTVYGNQV